MGDDGDVLGEVVEVVCVVGIDDERVELLVENNYGVFC